MNIQNRLARKLRTLSDAIRMMPAQWSIDHSNPKQRERFLRLASSFADRFSSVSYAGNEAFTTPLWADFNARLQRTLLPRPRHDFLRNPVIASTMVITKGGDIMSEELRYLKSRLSEEQLHNLLREDPIGRPYITNATYDSSHNTIHHAHHIAKFLHTTGTNPATISSVVEWGGGYGNLAKLWLRLSLTLQSWMIIDSPLLCTLQWLYLSSILGEHTVHIATSPEDIRRQGICLIPNGIAVHANLHADMFVSTWAVSESSPAAQQFVLDKNWFGARHLLLGYQDSNTDLPDAGAVGTAARNAGATTIELPSMPGNHYAFR